VVAAGAAAAVGAAAAACVGAGAAVGWAGAAVAAGPADGTEVPHAASAIARQINKLTSLIDFITPPCVKFGTNHRHRQAESILNPAHAHVCIG
jgi:hypothetical protein